MKALLNASAKAKVAILVAALGYFVDVYDLLIFSIVRVPSLKDIGVSSDNLLNDGVLLLNAQMIGMLLGGMLWGVLGDKLGRIQVLFGSILLYSIANLANAFVNSVEAYAVWRFLAGVGLAGEIGAGITLVSELMCKESRGLGTTVVATVGVSGALLAALVGDNVHWRTAYVIGGVMGLALLVLRVSVHESGLFNSIKSHAVVRGDLRMLFTSRERFSRYLSCIAIGLPVWFVTGVLLTFSPEISKSLGLTEPISVAKCMIGHSIGITLGDLASGLLSQYLRSRKKAIGLFLICALTFSCILLMAPIKSADAYYMLWFPLGFFIGYWAVFVTSAAEQFGTNLRATVTTTAPNFVRGTSVIMTTLFSAMKGDLGVIGSAEVVAVLTFTISAWALLSLRETFGTDLNFYERTEGGIEYHEHKDDGSFGQEVELKVANGR